MENRRSPSNPSKAEDRQKTLQRNHQVMSKARNKPQFSREFDKKDGKFSNKDSNLPNQSKNYSLQNSGDQKSGEQFLINSKNLLLKNKFNDRGKIKGLWETKLKPTIVSDAQVTDGKHAGKYLQISASPKTEQTSRHLREKMFRILSKKCLADMF